MGHEGARELTPISLHPHFLLVLPEKAKSEVLPVAYEREREKQSNKGEEAGAEEARPATVTQSHSAMHMSLSVNRGVGWPSRGRVLAGTP